MELFDIHSVEFGQVLHVSLEQALQLAEWWIFFYWDEPEWALTLAIGWQIFYMDTYFVLYIFLHVLNTIAVLIPSIYLTLYPGNVPSHRKGKHRIACILHHWTKIQPAAVSLSHDDDGLQTIINNDKSLSKQSKHVPTLMCKGVNFTIEADSLNKQEFNQFYLSL